MRCCSEIVTVCRRQAVGNRCPFCQVHVRAAACADLAQCWSSSLICHSTAESRHLETHKTVISLVRLTCVHVRREVMKDFNKSSCGKEVMNAAVTQLLLCYQRALELIKRAGPEGSALARDAVTVPSVMYECRRCAGVRVPRVPRASKVSCMPPSLLHESAMTCRRSARIHTCAARLRVCCAHGTATEAPVCVYRRYTK